MNRWAAVGVTAGIAVQMVRMVFFAVVGYAFTCQAGMTGPPKAISASSKAVRDKINLHSPGGCSHIYGFNYQPSWGKDGMSIWGKDFDAKKYRAELTLGKSYFPTFNTVRIWLSWRAYQADPEKFIRNFHEAVNICGDLDLLAVPVIFNRWKGEPLWEMVEDHELAADFESTFAPFLRDLILPMKGDLRILAWDLCNEPQGMTEIPWLAKTRDFMKGCDPKALMCIGLVSKVEHLENYAFLQDILTTHLYCPPFDPAPHGSTISAHFALAEKFGKPIMSTECCWGSLDDAERVAIARENLTLLTRHKMGFFPHALFESPVADLHRPQFGVVKQPGYMAFINMDGSLRAGHEVYNEFAK